MTEKKGDYLKRQTYMLSSLGLFYIILIGLFAIPLLAAFVVVLIQGVLELQYAIIYGGVAFGILVLFFLIRYLIRSYRRVRRDGFQTGRAVRETMKQGEPVQVSIFKGMLTFTYGGRHPNNGPLPPSLQGPGHGGLLPEPPDSRSRDDVVGQLRELSELKNDGVVTEAEFLKIKADLIGKPNDPGAEETAASPEADLPQEEEGPGGPKH
jgi:hypothetical protein